MKEFVVVRVHPADLSSFVDKQLHDEIRPDCSNPSGLYCPGEVRILVIDDDDAICRMIQMALGSSAYRVDAVSETGRIEEMLRSATYHIVLLDLVLPGIPSEQVWNLLREAQPDASIIVVTGYPSLDSALDCLRARTYDYLTKPFQLRHLQHVVQRCLESRGQLRLSEEALRESLGKVIRERRKTLGLTLAQMAQRTGVSLGYLSQIELGKNSASIETLYRISLGLGMKIAEMFQCVQNV